MSDTAMSATSPPSMPEGSTSEVGHIPVSVFLITLNEAAHIELCWRVLPGRTRSLSLIRVLQTARQTSARGWACSGTIRNGWLSAQKAAALARCRHSWCLNIDGDEIVPPELAAELQSWVGSNEISALESR